MYENFQIGDFVKLSKKAGSPLHRIEDINGTCCIVGNDKKQVSIYEIYPVKVDGMDDCEVFLDYTPEAIIIKDDFKYEGENYYEYYMKVLKEKFPMIYSKISDFKNVHEVQHYLETCSEYGLSLNFYKKTLNTQCAKGK